MKSKMNFLNVLIILMLVISSCEKNRCDEGYQSTTVNGQEICVFKFNIGIEFPIENGTKLYHEKHGIVEYNQGKWINQIGEDITTKIKNEK